MFDLATRPQPATTSAAAVFGVPFDLRLVLPTEPRAFPFTDFQSPTGSPQPGVEQLAAYSVSLEDTLSTAIILSLFTDKRAGRDDALPLNVKDRRGWVGDEFMSGGQDDQWGSTLWLCMAGKAADTLLEQARFAAQEALAWLIRDGIAERIDVTTAWVGERRDRLAVRPVIYRPGEVLPVYDVLWGTSIRRGVQ
ncbi:MAG: phage GP46 family protein [Burkholderiaceae bacterium]|nr:phage GP46 family protein [Burkholderiaceae bacterium]